MDQPVPTAIVEPSKINWLLFSLIGVAILITGIVAGVFVGKYIYTSKLTPSPIISASPSPTPTNQTCVTPPPECVTESGSIKLECSPPYIGEYCVSPTANWKTYTNNDFGFSFSYPKELTYLYDHLKGGNILLQNFDGSSARKELDSDFQMTITADNANSKPLEDYPKQWETELGKLPTETISVGGITAIKGFSGQKYQAVPTVWFSKNATTFMIQLSHPKSTNKIWFDQILSTFKFTN